MLTLQEEKILKEYIKNIIKENYGINNIEVPLKEKESHKKNNDNKNKEALKNKRSRVINRLKDPETNCAEIMRKLWRPSKDEEDSARSYFYKCRDGELNDSGVPYKFSDDEINRLYQLLTSSI